MTSRNKSIKEEIEEKYVSPGVVERREVEGYGRRGGAPRGGGAEGRRKDGGWIDPLEEEVNRSWNPDPLRTRLSNSSLVSEGMVSQAITMAFLEPRDIHLSTTHSSVLLSTSPSPHPQYTRPPSPSRIEATCYHSTITYVKRSRSSRQTSSKTGDYSYLQSKLNYLVALVRHSLLTPSDASRITHGIACLLPSLSSCVKEPPECTVLVTGMRRKGGVESLEKAFGEFGRIGEVNVSEGSKGFGFVRFRSSISVSRTLRRYVLDEILVDDVAVVVEILGSEKYTERQDNYDNVYESEEEEGSPVSYCTSPSSSNVSTPLVVGKKKSSTENWVRPTAVTVTRSKVVMHLSNSMSNDSSDVTPRNEGEGGGKDYPRSAPRMYHENALEIDLANERDDGGYRPPDDGGWKEEEDRVGEGGWKEEEDLDGEGILKTPLKDSTSTNHSTPYKDSHYRNIHL
ncbi:hypothetical protein TrVE_jg1976 [Triparma verrucosa]|uniref:RRM domain-containing protein n=2 Tax=Triparma TaxID=722752 RepID=A0A9W7C7H5_9STRA|nr:hypothetical protein TrVE_jg1976 [Triparma verrucosa]GMI00658.1 hypothetical protein TrST_g8805 [Triparma strigata]